MRRLRVGVDATSWVNRRGFGRFARNAVGRLVEADEETQYFLYIDAEAAERANLPARSETQIVSLSRSPSRAAASGSRRSVRDMLRLTAAVRRDRLDAFLFPSLYTYFPVLRAPTVVGVHDMIAECFPELTVPDLRARFASRLRDRVAVRRASRLFTVSRASQLAVAERLGISTTELAIVPEAPDPVFSRRTDDALAAGLGEVGLRADDSFFLFSGGISPHKNVETLVEAYAALRSDSGEAPLLVLAGDLAGEAYLSSARSVRERIARHGVEDFVRLPGYVSDEALACLYSAATAVVIPSLAEGFGLPAVEAAACGAALVLSDLPAHRESLGDAALFFPSTDVDALTQRLAEITLDQVARRTLGDQAQRRVAALTWDAAAAELASLIRSTTRLA